MSFEALYLPLIFRLYILMTKLVGGSPTDPLKKICLAEEGIDFAQDAQEGGADEFDFIPDSEEQFCR